MLEYKQKRQYIRIRNRVNEKLELNPFVLSKQFLYWLIIGLIGGTIAAVYWIALEFVLHESMQLSGWILIPLMTAAGFLVGLIIHRIGDPGEMDLIVNNIRFKGGRLDPKSNPSMLLSSFIGIAAGSSIGPEAPLVQVTGSTGTWLARKLRLKGEDLRSLTIAGMASGFTALFGAPLGSGFFALEILHHKHMVEFYQALIPAFVSSCAAFVIFILLTHIGYGPTWILQEYAYGGPSDFLLAVGVGVLGSIAGWLFIVTFRFSKALFSKIQKIYVKTTLGGFILGTIACFLPLTRFFGHYEITDVIVGEYSLRSLFILLIFKIIAIVVSATSGWRGGFIIPLFFLGACLGQMVLLFLPDLNDGLVIVGCMAAINACVTRTPISTIILLSTMTGFHGLMPIMFASLTGFFLAPKAPLIASQLKSENPER
ncbi:chloride channel protein [Catalinimonas niigatensis]|uniref:chloride channel protein n=1 Tax=Catalinimonas niigatensis TaxID=1397264 RepID=UPI002665C40A|nr:chloride channel protein [Catalinimonas niigatensis]WPP47985.1 chloride channel protein [Catalinimonas niigatensis]